MESCKYCGVKPILINDSESDSEVIYYYLCTNCINRSLYSHSIKETRKNWNLDNKEAQDEQG